jgi:hypothetical protein
VLELQAPLETVSFLSFLITWENMNDIPLAIPSTTKEVCTLFLSFRNKVAFFFFLKRLECQTKTVYSEGLYAAASCHPPSGRGIFLSSLPDWLEAYLGTVYSLLSHTRATHTHTQSHQLQSEQQEVAGCWPPCHWIHKHPLQTAANASYSLG